MKVPEKSISTQSHQRVTMEQIRLAEYVNLGLFKSKISNQKAFEHNIKGLVIYLVLLFFYILMQYLRGEFGARDFEINRYSLSRKRGQSLRDHSRKKSCNISAATTQAVGAWPCLDRCRG